MKEIFKLVTSKYKGNYENVLVLHNTLTKSPQKQNARN